QAGRRAGRIGGGGGAACRRGARRTAGGRGAVRRQYRPPVDGQGDRARPRRRRALPALHRAVCGPARAAGRAAHRDRGPGCERRRRRALGSAADRAAKQRIHRDDVRDEWFLPAALAESSRQGVAARWSGAAEFPAVTATIASSTSCPQCPTALVTERGAQPWCPACEWNLECYEPV